MSATRVGADTDAANSLVCVRVVLVVKALVDSHFSVHVRVRVVVASLLCWLLAKVHVIMMGFGSLLCGFAKVQVIMMGSSSFLLGLSAGVRVIVGGFTCRDDVATHGLSVSKPVCACAVYAYAHTHTHKLTTRTAIGARFCGAPHLHHQINRATRTRHGVDPKIDQPDGAGSPLNELASAEVAGRFDAAPLRAEALFFFFFFFVPAAPLRVLGVARAGASTSPTDPS